MHGVALMPHETDVEEEWGQEGNGKDEGRPNSHACACREVNRNGKGRAGGAWCVWRTCRQGRWWGPRAGRHRSGWAAAVGAAAAAAAPYLPPAAPPHCCTTTPAPARVRAQGACGAWGACIQAFGGSCACTPLPTQHASAACYPAKYSSTARCAGTADRISHVRIRMEMHACPSI